MFPAGWSSNTRSISSPPRRIRAWRWTRSSANSAPAQIPGDTYRNLQVTADYSAQTFKHVLLPIWLLNYQYSGTTYRIVANGVTGAIAGKYPKSWIKVGLFVIVVAIVLLFIFIYGQN